jgi:hypothetical protein
MANDSNNESTDTTSCKGKEDVNQHKADSLDRSSGSQVVRKHMTLVRGGTKPTSLPALHRGQRNHSSCKGALPDHHNQHKTDMLNGIWPGSHNVQLLNQFVEMHFFGNWTAYLYFAKWGKTKQDVDPDAVVWLGGWLLANAKKGGGKKETKGKYCIGSHGGVMEDSNMCNKTCDVPHAHSNDSQLKNWKTSPKFSSSTPCHADLRTIFPIVAQACTQEEHARDEMVEEEIAQQEREEQVTADRFQARKEKFAAAADTKINGP